MNYNIPREIDKMLEKVAKKANQKKIDCITEMIYKAYLKS